MNNTLELDFTTPHRHDSGIANNAILQKNRAHFSKQCQTIFDAMMRGERLTGKTCFERYGIMDFRRRCCELIASGVFIQERLCEDRFKEKWMTPEDMVFNEQFIVNNF